MCMLLLMITLLFTLLSSILLGSSLLKSLILLEVFGLVWFFLVVWAGNGTTLEVIVLLLFSLLVIEGVIGLYGLVLIIRSSGVDLLDFYSL